MKPENLIDAMNFLDDDLIEATEKITHPQEEESVPCEMAFTGGVRSACGSGMRSAV